MRRTLIVMLLALIVCACIGSTAFAAPNVERASCQAILTNPDAHAQIRDGLAREFAGAHQTGEGPPPGAIYSAAARATGTNEQECLESAFGG
jgi:hypothetical protein